MMDNKFTELIKQWLETPSNQRDYSVGALYLLKLSGNQIMYRNIVAQLDRRHDFVDYQIQKYYNFRVQALTHAQVEEMQQKVDVIVAEHISLAANATSFSSSSCGHKSRISQNNWSYNPIKSILAVTGSSKA
mgnify:CR=1 FL=1